jgi:adenylate kinase
VAGIPQISTGDMLREHIRRGDAIGRRSRPDAAGSLVPDDLVNQLVEERISSRIAKRVLSWTGTRGR